jgi:hypothetical protein
MTKQQQTRKIYSDGRHLYSAEEIAPLGFDLDDESNRQEAERQLTLPVKQFNQLAKNGGYKIIL